MKLQTLSEQLIGVKKFHNLTWAQLVNMLRQQYGITQIGEGDYGQVFSHPTWDYVVKVFDNDDAYLSFVNYCTDHHPISFPRFTKKVVKIHQFHARNIDVPKYINVVQMERLQQLRNPSKKLTTALEYYAEDIVNCISAGVTDYDLSFVIDGRPLTISVEEFLAEFDTEYGIIQTFKDLSDFFNTNTDYMPDLHDGNFMLRGKQLVCIDPITNGENWGNAHTSFKYFDDDIESITGPLYKAMNNK